MEKCAIRGCCNEATRRIFFCLDLDRRERTEVRVCRACIVTMAREKVTKRGKEAPTCKGDGASLRLTPEIIEAVLASVAMGRSLIKSITEHGISPGTWYTWANNDGAERYARAREMCAHAHADLILDLVQDVKDGNVPSDAARVALDGAKWTASKLHFRQYGDRQQVDNTHKFTDLGDDELEERIRRLVGRV